MYVLFAVWTTAETKKMGKREKQKKHPRHHRAKTASYYSSHDEEEEEEERCFDLPSPSYRNPEVDFDEEEKEEHNDTKPLSETPSKFLLYQQSVQLPKGDISYLQKFFLMYVGGRLPLNLQEDFCGTALLSTEWLRTDPRRTAVGVDMDLEALTWSMENNMSKGWADGYSRLFLFHGNVLQPLEAKLVRFEPQELISNIKLTEHQGNSESNALESTVQADLFASVDKCLKRDFPLPARDIVCAFNYSCCCLHKRADLVLYFKHVLNALSKKGGIFVMDLYGGTSSEGKLRLQRRFPNFTYIWEQAEFDIVERKTRISLHFHLQKQQKKLRHAFSYSWRLWSLPEIRDCLEEAGFRSVHFWLRQMPDSEEIRNIKGFGGGQNIKYEEVTNFEQVDSWNAYIVAVAN